MVAILQFNALTIKFVVRTFDERMSDNQGCQFGFFKSNFEKSEFLRTCLTLKIPFGFDSKFDLILNLLEKFAILKTGFKK